MSTTARGLTLLGAVALVVAGGWLWTRWGTLVWLDAAIAYCF